MSVACTYGQDKHEYDSTYSLAINEKYCIHSKQNCSGWLTRKLTISNIFKRLTNVDFYEDHWRLQ